MLGQYGQDHEVKFMGLSPPQVAMLRTCPNMILAVERDVKPQL